MPWLVLLALALSGACGRVETRAEVHAVLFRPAGREPVRVRVRIARTPAQRQRGLMYVRDLPPGEGMVFLFERQELQEFWMKNTYIPLDMIFIDESMRVVGVVENAEPETLSPRAVDEPSRYVVEVIGGWARTQGIRPGTPVQFEGFKP